MIDTGKVIAYASKLGTPHALAILKRLTGSGDAAIKVAEAELPKVAETEKTLDDKIIDYVFEKMADSTPDEKVAEVKRIGEFLDKDSVLANELEDKKITFEDFIAKTEVK